MREFGLWEIGLIEGTVKMKALRQELLWHVCVFTRGWHRVSKDTRGVRDEVRGQKE